MGKPVKDSLVVLIHSPLVGPSTWSLVARQLETDGFDVLVPVIADRAKTPPPYWQQNTLCVQQALEPVPISRPLMLVGHSGAGPLLPMIGQACGHPIAGYLLVDAGFPHPGKARLDGMPAELLQPLAAGERFPNWTEEDLREELPDGRIRQQILAEMQPHPLAFFEEVLPEVSGWPDASGGYVLFTEGYRADLEQAQRMAWPSRTMSGGHFHMLVDPLGVAAILGSLISQIVETHPD